MKTFILLLFIFSSIVSHSQNQKLSKTDSLSAIRIAEKNWRKKYGKMIYNSTPFYARLKNDSIWSVFGTLHGTTGGTPYAEIRRSDDKILFMIHMK
jgi:hypothetical protein